MNKYEHRHGISYFLGIRRSNMSDISAAHIQKYFFDTTSNLNQAIREATSFLLKNGYRDYSDDDRFLFIKSSNGHEHTVNINLKQYRNNSSCKGESSESKYDKRGFDKHKIHRDTKTIYDSDGFDSSGYDKNYNTREEAYETLDDKDVDMNGTKPTGEDLHKIKCSNCGEDLNPNTKFCTHCGTQVLDNSNIESNGKHTKGMIPQKLKTVLLYLLAFILSIFIMAIIKIALSANGLLGSSALTGSVLEGMPALLFVGIWLLISGLLLKKLKKIIWGFAWIAVVVISSIYVNYNATSFGNTNKNTLSSDDNNEYMKKYYKDLENEKATLDRLCGNDMDCRLYYFNRLKEINAASNKKSSAYNKAGLYRFEIAAFPVDAKVQIMNIKQKYYDGIQLKKGTYRIRVSKDGYKADNFEVDFLSDTIYPSVLKKR